MRKIILLLLLSLNACQNFTYKDTPVKGVITYKDSTKAYDKYEYHYGYSAWKGSFCWHWGNNHHSAHYITKVEVENSEIEIGKTNYKVGDTIQVVKEIVIDQNKKIVDTRYSTK